MKAQRRIGLFVVISFAWSVFLALGLRAYSEGDTAIAIPHFDDQYSRFVKKLEAGDTDVDYQAFRESLLDSKQFQVIGEQQSNLEAFRKTAHELIGEAKHQEILAVAKKMLSIDYTDMDAHKLLQQTYKILGDSANREKYHAIEFGLLNSIVKKGDGKTPATAWPVVQVTEEYFIVHMLGAKVLKQSLDQTAEICDKMEVQTENGKEVFYFDVRKVFDGYKKRGIR